MATFTDLLTILDQGILTITINKPEKLNALSTSTLQEISMAIDEALLNPDVKGIIFTGAGNKAFVAGANIREISNINIANARSFADAGQKTFNKIENSPKPVIAAVNGFALGGGCELALACHIRIASDNARFGLPEVSLGIIPGYGGTQRLTHLVGKGFAFELIMTGDIISAQRAAEIGLVNHLMPPEQLLVKCQETFSKIFTKAPLAVASAIKSINAATDNQINGYEVEVESFTACTATKDFILGTTAFLEKRTPVFEGK